MSSTPGGVASGSSSFAHLAGRVVIVTGGSTGIGRAASQYFAEAGMRVVLAARSRDAGEEVAAEIKANGGDAVFRACDVTDPRQVHHFVSKVVDSHGFVDCAFNNAGVSGDGELVGLSEEAYDRVFAVNTRGLWLCLREQLRVMQKQGHGSIVNNVSVHGVRVVFPGVGAYVASKHAALALSKAAALENARLGIRVNALATGPIESPMLEASEAAVGGASAWRRLLPTGEVGTPWDVAQAALWLFSDYASYVNGQALGVDGGFLAT